MEGVKEERAAEKLSLSEKSSTVPREMRRPAEGDVIEERGRGGYSGREAENGKNRKESILECEKSGGEMKNQEEVEELRMEECRKKRRDKEARSGEE